MSPEAWATITALALPIVGAMAANIKLTISVNALTREMIAVRKLVEELPSLKKRVAKLEGSVGVKRANR